MHEDEGGEGEMKPGAAEPILRLHRIRKEFVPSGGSRFLFPARRRRGILAVDDLSTFSLRMDRKAYII